jgi:hypothetical protein
LTHPESEQRAVAPNGYVWKCIPPIIAI